MSKIWFFLIFFSIIYAIFTGRIDQLTSHMLNVPGVTLKTLINIGGVIVFWSGMFQIAIDSGMISIISKPLKVLTVKIFKTIPKEHVVHDYIVSNLSANLLGLGAASTPMAIKAFREMKKLNNDENSVTMPMITLLLLNISAFTLFPITILGIRSVIGSSLNTAIWIGVITITFINTLITLIIVLILKRKKRYE